MQVRQISHEYSQILYYNDILTSLYLPLLTSYLYYNNLLLLMGKFVNIYYILILGTLELVKYVLHARSQKTIVHKRFHDFLKGIMTIILFFGVMYILTVLFGAAAFSNIEETAMFTLLVTTLTALPVTLHFGAENAINMFLSITSFDENELQNIFMLKLRLTLFGSWLGAVVIPLDWNRPWQIWPIPCCIGTLLGYMIANWCCLILQNYRRRKGTKKTGKFAL